jgi:Spy/CpxP family protein refolding chaperone
MNTTRYKKIPPAQSIIRRKLYNQRMVRRAGAILVVPAVAILAVLVLCTELSAARGYGRYGGGRGGWVYDRSGPERGIRAPLMEHGAGIMQFVRRLDLTDEQAEKIKDTIKANQEKIQTAQKAVVEARKALNETVAKGADEAAIRDAATAVGKALGDAAVLRANTKAAVEKILTDEQRTKLEELREEMKEQRDLRAGEVQRPGARGRFQQRGLREDVWPGGPSYGRGPMGRGGAQHGFRQMREPLDRGPRQPWRW